MIQPLFWFLLGNAENYASQHGCLIMLTDARATDVTTHARLIGWKSYRSGRVCRSTLAAEASAADTSVDRSTKFLQPHALSDFAEGAFLQNHHATARDSSNWLQNCMIALWPKTLQ